MLGGSSGLARVIAAASLALVGLHGCTTGTTTRRVGQAQPGGPAATLETDSETARAQPIDEPPASPPASAAPPTSTSAPADGASAPTGTATAPALPSGTSASGSADAPPPASASTSVPMPSALPPTQSSSHSERAARPPADIQLALDDKLRPSLLDPSRARERRQEFARAVVRISTELSVPISAEQAMRDMPCGGWSGPGCSNLALGLEIAKLCAPLIASFHQKRTAEIIAVLAEAISIHSIWHDAYGYVRRIKKKGPGYTYAGCLFSRCDPADLKNGQVDGLLYQVSRLLGVLTSPACGPACALADR